MPLTLVSSTSPSALAARLAGDLSSHPLDPFTTDVCIVQSRGIERWIKNELATRLGCAANIVFPFASPFFHDLAAPGPKANPADATTPYRHDDRHELTWRILALLEADIADEPHFEPIRAFVGPRDIRDTRKLLGLASALVARFEEYQLFRPDMLLAWSSEVTAMHSTAERWQSELWRRATADLPHHTNVARLYTDLLARLTAGDDIALPERLSIIGVNTLPPILVQLVHAVARRIPVRMYLHVPPRGARADERTTSPLFSTFGTVVRELIALLESCQPPGSAITYEELDVDRTSTSAQSRGAEASLLHTLQHDIATGTQRGPEPENTAATTLQPDDISLTVHRCHSPLREMEVLRDHLLAALADDPSLRPHDILLLVPDMRAYAPVVEAVFGVREAGFPWIPHHIADRPIAQESRVVDAALRLLRLVGARWTTTEIIELLGLAPIRAAAGLDNASLDTIVAWIDATNIRWGRDGATRAELFNLPALDANTWRAGLDRLLMGYATGRNRDLIAGILPHSGDLLGDPATLGVFSAWLESLFEMLADWRTARSLTEWATSIRDGLVRFIAPADDNERRDLDVMLRAVAALADVNHSAHDPANNTGAVELPTVRDWLESELADDQLSSGFLTGGMTVCALKPMRVVPHRIIAIAGLDDASFPRAHTRPAFDLIAAERRAGDRSNRADDRQLFLETLLAAGDRLHLSYVACSARNNAQRASSVVIAELLDVVDRSAVPASGTERASALITHDHALQPFSARYFGGDATGRLFTYSRANGHALAAIIPDQRPEAITFVTEAFIAPGNEGVTLDVHLDDLIACWRNPARFYCRRTLGIIIPDSGGALDESEPMTMDQLARYGLHATMLGRFLARTADDARDSAEAIAAGALPSGELGNAWLSTLREDLEPLLGKLDHVTIEEPASIDIRGRGWRLHGRVNGITGEGRIHVRPARSKPKDLLAAWITHVALTAAHGPMTTSIVARDCTHSIPELAQERALELLTELVDGYRAMLAEPIPFFENASHAYVAQTIAIARPGSRAGVAPEDKMRSAYIGSDFAGAPPGDGTEAHTALAWRGRDPLDPPAAAVRWAERFWTPAFAMITKS